VLTIKKTEDSVIIQTKSYIIIINKNNPYYANLFDNKKNNICSLFLLSGCDSDRDWELIHNIDEMNVNQKNKCIEISFSSKSNVWEKKEYVLQCYENHIEYFIKINGKGNITDLHFFEGILRDSEKHNRFGTYNFHPTYPRPYRDHSEASKYNFTQILLPQPNSVFKQYFRPYEFITNTVHHEANFFGGTWMFTPAPFVYPAKFNSLWTVFSLAVKPKEYNFIAFEYVGGEEFGFKVTYQGYTTINKQWESPHIQIFFSDDEFKSIAEARNLLVKTGFLKNAKKTIYRWWKEPLFCGWGEQCSYAYEGGNPTIYATEQNYRRFIKQLEDKGVNPGTIIIDDRWMFYHSDPYPDKGKWNDLKKFIAEQHKKGRRILMWIPFFQCDGLPIKECITKDNKPVSADPTNPDFVKRFTGRVRFMLSKDGLDADGFKVDFTANVPSGEGYKCYGKIWGVEILRQYLNVLYKEAKKIKKDCLVISHCCNPYFEDITDMLRLNDIHSTLKNIVPTMTFRAKVARAASPLWLIDMDNWPCPSYKAWKEYMKIQPQYGVPSLYYCSQIDGDRKYIEDKDYKLIKELWGKYRSNL